MTIADPAVWPNASLAGQRTLMQIDATYLATLGSAIGLVLDFRALRRQLEHASRLVRIVYYAELNDGDDNRRRLTDWLDYNGYTVSVRSVRSDRGSLIGPHVAMAVDALSQIATYDHLVLLAGSSALLPVVTEVRRRGPQVTLLTTLRRGSAEIDDHLRRAADHVVDAADLQATLALPAKPAASAESAADPRRSA